MISEAQRKASDDVHRAATAFSAALTHASHMGLMVDVRDDYTEMVGGRRVWIYTVRTSLVTPIGAPE